MEFLRINNRNNFIIEEVPLINPNSRRYTSWWKEQKERCIDGYWSIDDEDIEVDISVKNPIFPEENNNWRFIPPACYFYINFGTILVNIKGVAGSKVKAKPNLDDIEWEFHYNLMEARGFSGFEFDEEFSCNRFLVDKLYQNDDSLKERCVDKHGNVIKHLHDNFFKKDGARKTFIPCRQYIRQLFNKNMGRPTYANIPQNMMILGTRDGGKSYLSGGAIAHELTFDGVRRYDKNPEVSPIAEIVVGAAISDKSRDLMSKVKLIMDNLPGTWKPNTTAEVPAPFFKHMSGSIGANKEWTHKYLKIVGSDWKNFGSMSNVKHRVFTTENTEAAAGGRLVTIVIEEVGLLSNVISVHGCFGKETKIRMYDGSLKNAEDIIKSDQIMGHDGSIRTVNKLFRGEDNLYKVSQSNGIDYVVNSKHRLYLDQNRGIKSDGIKTISAEDYCNNDIAKSTRRHTYGVKSGVIEFEPIKLKLDSYFMGLWLGDGIVKSAGICYDSKTDINTQEWLIDYYKSLGLSYSLRDVKGAILCSPISYSPKQNSNYIRNELRNYNTLKSKFLHPDFVKSSKEDRLKLLAGLIDSDGTLSKRHGSYEYVFYQSGREDLIDKVKFIARSLGFRVSDCIHIDKRKDHYKPRNQVTITGNIEIIPCKHKRKQIPIFKKVYKRSTIRTKLDVEYIGIGDYYGFQLKEDDKLLLEDNTITYNSNDAAQNDSGEKFGTSLYVGTAGNIDKVAESQIIFGDPEGYDMLQFDNIWENEVNSKICWFIPATHMARKFKDKNGNTLVDKARAYFLQRRELRGRAASKRSLELEQMNYPLVPSEMFVNADKNPFPSRDLRSQYAQLLSNKKALNISYKVEFFIKENGTIDFKNIAKKPIRLFPLKNDDKADLSGCPEIFQMPVKLDDGTIPSGIYIAGFDPIDDDDNTDTKRSLQSFFIMNRLTGELVFEYTGRTNLAAEFYEQCRRALLYFNGRCNYENNKKGFYGHMMNKASLHLLVETPEILLQKDYQKSRGVGNKSLGTNMNTDVKAWGIELILAWLVDKVPDDDTGEKMMLHTIKSPALLKELMLFNPDGNFDRVSALMTLLILREDKRRFVTKIKQKTKSVLQDDFFKRTWNNNKVRY